MKYVRTKNGKVFSFYVIEEHSDIILCYADERDKNALDGGHFFYNKDIRIADTIYKLCDKFVVIVDGKHYIRVPASNPNFQTYGAIWTDKGLIYVAKMNDKGELKLL